MARRHRAEKRVPIADPKFESVLVAQFINQVMRRGKKTIAQRIVYGALEDISKRIDDTDPVEVFKRALDNARPQVEVKSRRVGGATYQVPIEVNDTRGRSLAMRWIITFSSAKKSLQMSTALANELVDAFNGTGSTVKKRDDTHKMAQANRAFAHYRW